MASESVSLARPVVFIGSSGHGLPIAHTIAERMTAFANPLVWDRVFGPTGGTFQDLTGIIPKVDAAILVLSPDDEVTQHRHGETSEVRPAPRDNVVFEIGLWIGALGRERVVFMDPSQPRLALPSDLEGINSVRYPGIDRETPHFEQGMTLVIDKLKRWLTGEAIRQHTRPIIEWPNPRAEAASLLRSGRDEARHSLMLLGNTMAQTQAAYQGDLARWLAADSRRRIGMLFINSHSPHAIGRNRPHLQQGTRESGLRAYRQALEQPIHPQAIPLVYDGPYRYSLRGIDIAAHTRNAASEIHITHSTHERGIAGGFGHSLPLHRGVEAFTAFADDVLALWKSAHANPPGHGITLAVNWEPGHGPSPIEMEVVLGQAARDLIDMTGRQGELHLNHANQWHFTLASLKRTGPRWGGPYSLHATTPEEQLPAGFVEHAIATCEQLRNAIRDAEIQELAPVVTHLRLTRTGHLIAFQPTPTDRFQEVMNTYLRHRTEEVQRLGLDPAFAPKHIEFWPHVSIGMAFQTEAALPEPLVGEQEYVVELAKPLTWRTSRFDLVHYAYRTFRRKVGMVPIPLSGPALDRHEWINRLGVG